MEQLFQKLNEIIKEYDSFIIMGHKDPDLDSLGSGLGLVQIRESFNKEVYIFLNDKHLENYNTNINQALKKLEKNIKYVNNRNYSKVNGKKLLIITDVHSENRLEYPSILSNIDVVVLDHHIKNKDYIKDTKFLYIDSNLSSMSELITYYANYQNVTLDSVIATILLAGIEIDTNGFNLKTTSKTYESASILVEMGADSILKQELLKESKEEYMKRASFIRNSFMVTDNIAMCIVNTISTSLELSSIAEELLTFEDIEATFVIGKLENNVIGVSARSLGSIDISTTINELGGGGHSSNAAAQIKGLSIREVEQKIKNIIKN